MEENIIGKLLDTNITNECIDSISKDLVNGSIAHLKHDFSSKIELICRSALQNFLIGYLNSKKLDFSSNICENFEYFLKELLTLDLPIIKKTLSNHLDLGKLREDQVVKLSYYVKSNIFSQKDKLYNKVIYFLVKFCRDSYFCNEESPDESIFDRTDTLPIDIKVDDSNVSVSKIIDSDVGPQGFAIDLRNISKDVNVVGVCKGNQKLSFKSNKINGKSIVSCSDIDSNNNNT